MGQSAEDKTTMHLLDEARTALARGAGRRVAWTVHALFFSCAAASSESHRISLELTSGWWDQFRYLTSHLTARQGDTNPCILS